MPDSHDPDRANDNKVLTPLLLMALLVVGGILWSLFMTNAPT